MAYSVSHIIGPDFNNTVQTNPNSAGTAIPVIGPLGLEAFGSDGRLYVLAQASGTIASGASTVGINTSTFAATSGTGSYTAPTITGGLADGNVAWFSKASV